MQGLTAAAAAGHLADNAASAYAAVDVAESSAACFQDQFADEGQIQDGSAAAAAAELVSARMACYQNPVDDESVATVPSVYHAHAAGSQLARPADLHQNLAGCLHELGCQHQQVDQTASVATGLQSLRRLASSAQIQQASCRGSRTALHELQRLPSPGGQLLPSRGQESSNGLGWVDALG